MYLNNFYIINNKNNMEDISIIFEIPYYEQCLQIIKNKTENKFNFRDCYIKLDENNNKHVIYSQDFEIPLKFIDSIMSIKFHNGEVEKIVNQNSIKRITYDILNVLDKKYDYNLLENEDSLNKLKLLEKEILDNYDSTEIFTEKIKNILDNRVNYDNLKDKINTSKKMLLRCFSAYIISMSDLQEFGDNNQYLYACNVVKTILDFQVVYTELNIILDKFNYKKTEQNIPSIWDYFGMGSCENSLSK
jgi:hypothetical protein